jgi:D-beta-D-heptose 7-phosphate kinase/D-beta-D-heptose 1-phosphate adenosyltransferase
MKIVAISLYGQIIHRGHIDHILEAKKLGDYLIAIVNSDKQALLKSTPAVVNEKDREYIIKNIKGVDETIIAIDEDGTVAKTLELIRPNIFCNGGDRNPNTASSKEVEVCTRLGIELVYNVGGGKHDSSSNILKRASEILNKNK